MAQKARRPSKAASLTGDLLVRGSRESKSGFVIATREEAKPASDSAPAAPPPAAGPPPAPATSKAESPERSSSVRPGDWSNPVAQASGPQALVRALRAGHLERAERLFATLSGLDRDTLKDVLYGDRGRNLALACRALGFDSLQFASTLILSRRLGLAEAEGDPVLFSDAAALFEDADPQAARDALARWRGEQGET